MIGIIHNIQSGEIEQYELSESETKKLLAQREINIKQEQELQKELQNKKLARESLLAKLGITEEEAKLLLS